MFVHRVPAGTYSDDHLFGTPDKHLEHLDLYDRFADSFSLSDDGSTDHSPQISPASVLPTPATQPLKVGQF